MAILTAIDIKNAKDVTHGTKDLDVPEWGGSVRIKRWTGRDRSDVQKLIGDAQDTGVPGYVFWASLCVRGLVSESGDALFNGDGVETLLEKSCDVVQRVGEAILEHNALGKTAQEQAAKNSTSSQSYDSGTESLAV